MPWPPAQEPHDILPQAQRHKSTQVDAGALRSMWYEIYG